jgi:hypothetical protein
VPADSAVIQAVGREIEGETGCTVRVEEYLGAIGYDDINATPRVVLYWRMAMIVKG